MYEGGCVGVRKGVWVYEGGCVGVRRECGCMKEGVGLCLAPFN